MPTRIEWADEVWNPLVGCSPVSAGCDHCYAARQASRHASEQWRDEEGWLATGGKWSGRVKLLPERLEQPARWKKPRRIFVCSMGDLFHESVTDGFIMWVWWVMARHRRHQFIILTKRPERMNRWFQRWVDRYGDDGYDPKLALGPEEIRKVHSAQRALLFAEMLDFGGNRRKGRPGHYTTGLRGR